MRCTRITHYCQIVGVSNANVKSNLLLSIIIMHDRIDEHNVIKVADFGLCEDVYSYGYFCQRKDGVLPREEKVPIRWMAPESIEGGKYSEKTDVVR